MHRTTVSFGDEDWRFLRRLAEKRRMSVSQLIGMVVAKIGQEAPVKQKPWRFHWEPKPMGQPNADFRTREGLYEFLSH